jgi:hypothetical protein
MRLFLLALISIAIVGCANQSKIKVERTITKQGEVVEHVLVEGEALPRHWKNIDLNWAGVIRLQGGEAIVVQPDYQYIVDGVIQAMCLKNPLLCAGD